MKYRFLRFPEGKLKVVTFSYDDGCIHDIKLAEIFNKYGMKGTFNLNSSWIGTEKYMNLEQIKTAILDAGHEIAIHGEQHRANGKIRPIEGIRDVLNCRLFLEKEFGVFVRGMAYPHSGINFFCNGTTFDRIVSYLQDLDISYARSLNKVNGNLDLPTNWYEWNPTIGHNSENIFTLIEKFMQIDPTKLTFQRRVPKIFFVWGHSYDFNNNNSWDRIEKICEQLKGDDIWYATNGEICDYINAYHQLVYSADGSMVYNPTVKTIWFETNNASYKILPNETINID
ncbi:MAG: polysaccharide deacetylase family protein [Clostridia bacterium]|nr:polysaccharide deacetylase family protein [Clostridia bacterium]